ncbi:hypothetical protein ASD54_25245 [Rhizobium sp. Root149]|uniref:COG3904 family protein n=1 Tax=Rhizobium sp. Root149 TaxID=1736473 RepID=UPI000714937E|nr:hypothetical protein [Rhizobium sp. Root149]KQZ56251.1 hypothetical protein ASD54_25245 [Rhizobium sp. Root149]
MNSSAYCRPIWRSLITALLTVFWYTMTNPAAAADFVCGGVVPETVRGEKITLRKILLQGSILAGDVARFEETARSCEPNGKFEATVVVMHSPGGSLREAIRLGTLFYDNITGTRVEADGTCLSACAIAFMGGRYRGEWGNRAEAHAWRTLHPTAILGFHAPFVPEIDIGSPERAARLAPRYYEAAIQTSAELLLFSNRVGFSVDLLEKMLSTPSGGFATVKTVGDLGRWAIDVLAPPPPDTFTDLELAILCNNVKGGWDAPWSLTTETVESWIKHPMVAPHRQIVFSREGYDGLIYEVGNDMRDQCDLSFFNELYSSPEGIMQYRQEHKLALSAAILPSDTPIATLPGIWASRTAVTAEPLSERWTSENAAIEVNQDRIPPLRLITLKVSSTPRGKSVGGLRKGMTLAEGVLYGSHFAGSVSVFTSRCGLDSFDGTGVLSIDRKRLTLKASRPVRDELCNRTGWTDYSLTLVADSR